MDISGYGVGIRQSEGACRGASLADVSGNGYMGLDVPRDKMGASYPENLSYEERRRRIYEKRDYRAPMTPYRMETYLKNATGFDAFIADINEPGEYGFVADHPNRFKAYFMGEGTLDSRVVHKLLDKLKQSHTVYTVNQRTEIVVDERDL